ncbi:hypothetical protein MNBD_GAMMA11-1062 [hydrothermal vent metagenome]|uniref:Bacterial toxin 35 domain-containing protein n=1 Tax=hydrothermal vent metagenome TaxID=652676 RepID=A0A3B0XA72_9ZZZZ
MYKQSYRNSEKGDISLQRDSATNLDVRLKDYRKTSTNMNQKILMRKSSMLGFSQAETVKGGFLSLLGRDLPIQRVGAASLTGAIDALDEQENKQTHILAGKHEWAKVVNNPDWTNVKPIMKTVVSEGAESSYKGTAKKSSGAVENVNGEDTETVDVTWVNPGGYYVSDGWVRTEK